MRPKLIADRTGRVDGGPDGEAEDAGSTAAGDELGKGWGVITGVGHAAGGGEVAEVDRAVVGGGGCGGR